MTDRKAAASADKLDYATVPPAAEEALARAMMHGAKYGRFEWRDGEISARARYAAIRRHLADWASGMDADPDSGLPLLGLVMGGCAVLIDAKAHRCLNDDRTLPVARKP